MLKIYTQDCSWRGSILVIATSEEAARKLMENEPNYNKKGNVEEHEIKDGFVFCNTGDM